MEALINELMLVMNAQALKPLDNSDLMAEILETTARVLNEEVDDIISTSHRREVSDARKIAIYLIVEHTILPYRLIAERLGKRDHSTITYNRQEAEDLLNDKRFAKKFYAVKRELGL